MILPGNFATQKKPDVRRDRVSSESRPLKTDSRPRLAPWPAQRRHQEFLTTQKVLILGAGKIGALISGFLAECRDYEVHVADVNGNAANSVVAAHGLPNLHAYELDAANPALLEAHLREHPADTIISSLPYFCNPTVAEIARAQLHYFDLTEDVAVTGRASISAGADHAFIPQCGLAPGFISIVTNDLIDHFESIDNVKMRVGALPVHPSNALKYSLTWSTDGLINEYGNLCEALRGGGGRGCAAGRSRAIELDGLLYEAFNTSGGLGTLADTYRGRVRDHEL